MPAKNKRDASGAKRDIMGVALAAVNRVGSSELIDRIGARKRVEQLLYRGTKTGFQGLGAATRTFAAVQKQAKPARPSAAPERNLFDLTPTDEQKMIAEATTDFALTELRPAAAQADHDTVTQEKLLAKAANELGVTFLGVPEELRGAGTERNAITNVLVAEALAKGDMGQAVAILAPAGVSNALVLWGDETQQSTYLPSFVGDNVPVAAFAVVEPTPLFDPFVLKTTARRQGNGFVLDGGKSLVPNAAKAELFVIAAELEGTGPALFIVESSTAGLTLEAEPAMGLRAASLGRVAFKNVSLPATALLAQVGAYADAIRLSRVGWSALALGTSQAVLDYVIPYVNEREAFGEPISHRQAVAFMVANIGIELEGMRLATYRAASLAEQGKDFTRQAALARQLTKDYSMKIGNDGVQLLGGHGYVKEHPVERWYRDLRAVGVMEGVVLV